MSLEEARELQKKTNSAKKESELNSLNLIQVYCHSCNFKFHVREETQLSYIDSTGQYHAKTNCDLI